MNDVEFKLNRHKSELIDDWWLSHRVTLGNAQYMEEKFLIATGVLVVLSWIIWYISLDILGWGYIASFFDTFIVFACNGIIIFGWCKTPYFIDNFFVRLEMRCVAINIATGISTTWIII